MKIKENERTVFVFPTRLIANRFTSGIVRKALKKRGVALTRRQTRLFIKELKRYKKTHTEWKLVEVYEKSGNTATITL